MRLRGVLLAIVVAPALVGSATTAATARTGRDYFSFRDPSITESSGVVASSIRDGIYYTHNDSGGLPELFAVDDLGCTLTRYDLVDADGEPLTPWTDVEDIARGPHHGESVLWLGDIGDNNHQRREIAVYRVTEPNANASSHGQSGGCPSTDVQPATATTYRLAYPDTPHDAETLLADPTDGRLYVVTKFPAHHALVYAAPLELDADSVNVLELVGAFAFPPSTTYDRDPAEALQAEPPRLEQGLLPQTPFDFAARLWAVGGDVHPNRERIVIRTYSDAWEWTVAEGQSLGDALTTGVPTQTPLIYERQGEAIAYARSGSFLVTTCEDVGCTAHRYD